MYTYSFRKLKNSNFYRQNLAFVSIHFCITVDVKESKIEQVTLDRKPTFTAKRAVCFSLTEPPTYVHDSVYVQHFVKFHVCACCRKIVLGLGTDHMPRTVLMHCLTEYYKCE